MNHSPFNIEIEKGNFVVTQFFECSNLKIEVRFKSHISHQKSGISLNSKKKLDLSKIGFKLDGNNGNQILGTGIWLGVGSGITRIQKLSITLVQNDKRSTLYELDVNKLIQN